MAEPDKIHELSADKVAALDKKIITQTGQHTLYGRLSDLQLIQLYRELREGKDEAKAVFAAASKPTATRMELIETVLKGRLIDRGAKSVATDSGTAYKTVVSSVQVKDWAAFLEFVIEGEAWHLLERRASKTEIVAITEEGDPLPPGLAMAQRVNLNIKKPVAKPA